MVVVITMDYSKTGVVDHEISKEHGARAGLVIVVSEPWNDSSDQLTYLSRKLDSYFDFVRTGEHVQKFPNAAGKPVDIDIYCFTEPTRRVNAILDLARAHLPRGGMRINVELLPLDVQRAYSNPT
jgi:hypothetical protein